MNQIAPTIRLLTYQETIEAGTNIRGLILEHQGNNYHLHGGTRDTIHVFTESIGIYVLTINKCLGYMGLNSYMVPECDHTCASRLVNAGVDLYVVKEWLGHSTIQVTERYAHLAPQKLAHAAMMLEDIG